MVHFSMLTSWHKLAYVLHKMDVTIKAPVIRHFEQLVQSVTFKPDLSELWWKYKHMLLKSDVTCRDHVVCCHGSHECWFTHRQFHSQFHSRWHSLRITLKYTTLVHMRSGYAWTMKSWQRSEWRLGFNSINGCRKPATCSVNCVNYNSFIQIMKFHEFFCSALRCRKTGACRILVLLRYLFEPLSVDYTRKSQSCQECQPFTIYGRHL